MLKSIRVEIPYMKKFIFILLLFAISCTENKEKNPKKAPVSLSAKTNLLSIIHGGWVKQEYVDSIIKTKSPYRSNKQYLSNVELIIDTANLTGDTVMNPACFSNGKESFYFKIVIKQDSLNKPSMQMVYNHNYMNMDFFLEYSISAGDTILYMVKKDLINGEIKSKIPYKRIYNNPSVNYYVDPTTVFLNRTLITGKYKLYDAKNRLISNKVEFKEAGQVEGFSSFKNFYLESYYGSANSQNYNFDYIVLSAPEKRSVYRWTLKKDIFKFYDIIPDGNKADMEHFKFTFKKDILE